MKRLLFFFGGVRLCAWNVLGGMFRGLEGAEEWPGGVFQVYLGADADEDEMARAHVDLYRGFESPRGDFP